MDLPHVRPKQLLATLAVALAMLAAGCGSDAQPSAAGAAASPGPPPSTPGVPAATDASVSNRTEFCDAVARFDATSSPGGPTEPTAAAMTAYASEVGPAVDSMVADAPGDAVDATDTLAAAVARAADGDTSVGEDLSVGAAVETIEQAVRDHCDVGIVDVVGRDFAFDVPDVVPAGPVSFRMTNDGAQPHVLLLLKAPPDVTDDTAFLHRYMEVVIGVEAGGDPAAFEEFAPYDVAGNPPFAEPGGSGTTVKVLEPGEYLYFCPIPMDFADPQSPTHFDSGMHGRFTVES